MSRQSAGTTRGKARAPHRARRAAPAPAATSGASASVLHQVTVSLEDAGLRLDVVLARALAETSRTAVAALVRAGLVRIGGAVATKSSRPLKEGEQIAVEVPPREPLAFLAEDIPLQVLHEDDDLLVIDKPAGLVVHPATSHRTGTLVNALLGRGGALAPGSEIARPGIVHRLDKDTSGCMVIAKTAFARERLEASFKHRKVRKTYLAVVHGWAPPSGMSEGRIGRDPRNRKRMAVLETGGKVARTRFTRLERWARASLLEVQIETGRTHQIRVHLASLGFPIVGDAAYGGRRPGAPGALGAFPRQALHASELRFRHPRGGEELTFRAPVPMDLEELITSLRRELPPGGRGSGRRS